jgi:multidrug efflux pump
MVGTVVQLVTNGLKLSDYRPAGVDDPVDIRLRLPEDRRTLAALDELRVETSYGAVPISNFVSREPEPRVGTLHRIDGERTIVVSANVASGYQVASVQAQVAQAVEAMDLGATRFRLAGSSEESDEASAFLGGAFGTAIFLIFVVLLAQFNKFTSVFLILMTVVMSTIGVFLGLLITGQPFGIVMSGLGIIALAGVVVNNNIVLIDTYDRLRSEGWDKREAVLQTCRERARPVVLTAVSAILGVLPIALGLGLELFHHEVTIDAPSTQWWMSMSSAIVWGLAFATLLTLVVTPAALMVFTRKNRDPNEERRSLLSRLFRRRRKDAENAEELPAGTHPSPAE